MSSLFRRGFLLAALCALCACTSAEKKSSAQAPAHTPACICGTPAAAMDDCPHPLCVSGKGNPSNPDCFCGTLQFGSKKD